MGHCKKILNFDTVGGISTFYSDLLSIEVAENIHLHLRNLRIEMDHVEFAAVCKALRVAYANWGKAGKPETRDFLRLYRTRISPIPSLWNSNTANDETRVELQHWSDYVHLHHRNIRLEFSVREFLQFASLVDEAKAELLETCEQEPIPPRWGMFHRANPDGRVVRTDRKTSFWCSHDERPHLENPYASNYFHEDDALLKAKRTRKVENDRHILLGISDLYDVTLFHSAHLSPWMADERGVLKTLKARYDFVKLAIEQSCCIGREKIEETEYWELLNRPIDITPRDGGGSWVYADPKAQCDRYLKLIWSLNEHGYLGTLDSEVFAEFDGDMLTRILLEGREQFIRNNDGGYAGMITVKPCSGAYRVWNGLHRIAILKCLLDLGRLEEDRIRVCKVDGTAFSHRDFLQSTGQLARQRAGAGLRTVIARVVPTALKPPLRRLRDFMLPNRKANKEYGVV